jgi:hypothetical protein
LSNQTADSCFLRARWAENGQPNDGDWGSSSARKRSHMLPNYPAFLVHDPFVNRRGSHLAGGVMQEINPGN